jgi:predicted dinucleotide-binding enzyme
MGHSDNEKKLMALADEVKRLRSETKKRPVLRAVPSPGDVDDAAEAAMELIDKIGAPPLPRAAWIGLLEEVIGQCRTRITAAHEDEEHGRG